MNTDDIFKLPTLPKAATKRKFEAPEPPVFGDVTLKSSSVTIEDAAEGDDDDDNRERMEAFAPGNDADYFREEDADGRFFGGGLNNIQKQVLNIMEAGDELAAAEEITSSSIKKQLLALEKAINKNREMRTKFGNDPEKFVDSEFLLLEALHALLLLASSPLLAYPLLLEFSTPTSLADLISHENTEVVIAVIEVLEEWTDEEVLDGEVEEEEDEDEVLQSGDREERRQAMRGLVAGLLQCGVIESSVGSLERFDEADETERGGVYHTLGLLENLLSLSPPIASTLLSSKSALLSFLLKRLGQDKLASDRDQNRFYAAELLSILLGGDVEGALEGRERIAKEGAVDILLRVLSVYRRRDPSSADELEFLENIFDSLCSALLSPLVKAAFLEGEGVELCVLMMKERKVSWTRSVKVLDHAMSGRSGIELCEKFVEALGLKTLFKAFMGKNSTTITNGKKSKLSAATHEDTEHLLSLISSLLTSLATDSPARLRLLAKFVETDYEKVDRLIEIREEVETRVNADDGEIDDEELDEDDKYLIKLDKGLFSLQLVDYIIAWLCMEDDGVRDHVKMLLARKDRSLSDVMKVLIEYHDNMGDLVPIEVEGAEQKKKEEGEVMTEVEEQRAILDHLLTYLNGLDS